MSDPLDNAMKKSDGYTPSTPTNAETSKTNVSTTRDKLVAAKRPSANSHATKTESDRSKLLNKEELEKPEPAKKEFTPQKLSTSKFSKFLDVCQKINDVASERTSTSNQNIKKSKDLFTYPLKE